MRILYDHQIFEIQKVGGVSRYFYELIKNFKEDNLIETELSIKKTNNIFLKNDYVFSRTIESYKDYDDFFPKRAFKGKKKLYNLLVKKNFITDDKKLNLTNSENYLKKGDYDLFHPTYYNNYFLDLIEKKPFVITIFDMIYEIFPEYFSFCFDIMRMKMELAKKASKVIVISNSTKEDLIKIFEIDRKKIEVIYLGCSFEGKNANDFITKNQLLINLPERYILYIGSRYYYKNFYYFIRAISKMLNKDTDLSVVCAGSEDFNKEDYYYFESLGLKNKIISIKDCDDDSLTYLYKNATAFVFPSLYEGFGIPILEAFVCGCPVVISNTSSFPEVAGNAAMYFDPKNLSSIYEAINEVVYNHTLRNELIEKGYNQVKNFSWENTAKETIKVYDSIF